MSNRVKGTMLVDWIRIIRSNKNLNWDRHLKPEDWEIINNQILPSNWYPYDSFRRIGFAVFKEVAKSNLDTARVFGRFTIRNLLPIYKQILVPGDPVESVDRLSKLRRTFIDADAQTRLLDQGEGWLKYELRPPPGEDDPEKALAFAYQVAGNIEEIVEQAGGKRVTSQVEVKDMIGSILVKWE